MTTAEKIAALAHYAANTREVDKYEDIHRFRAFTRRCEIAAEWGKTIAALEAESALEVLPAQIVRESNRQLRELYAEIASTIEDGSIRDQQQMGAK
jgi:hypothetical protein